jgi:hypothetical protein
MQACARPFQKNHDLANDDTIRGDKSVKRKPSGSAGFHLNASFIIHSTYGSLYLSANIGTLSVPITVSNSACARVWSAGLRAIARKNDEITDTLYVVEVSREVSAVYIKAGETYSVASRLDT